MNLNVSLTNLWRRAHKLYFIDSDEEKLVKSSLSREEVVKLLEEEAKKYFKVPYVLFTPSGRAALDLALQSINIKENDEIVTQAYQCHDIPPLINKKGKLKYADVDKDGFNMNARTIAKVLSKKTKVVMPVNLYGFAGDTKSIASLCKKKKLVMIEDCAHSFGSSVDGKKSGTLGEIAIFSFCKTFAAPAGGLLITRNKKIFDKSKELLEKLVNKSSKTSDVLARRLIFNMTSMRGLQKKLPVALAFDKLLRDSKGEDYFLEASRAETCICLAQLRKIDSVLENYTSRYKEFYDMLKRTKGITTFQYKNGMNCLRFPILFHGEKNIGNILDRLYSEGAFEPSLNYKKDYDIVKGLGDRQNNSEDISNRLIVVALDNLGNEDLEKLKGIIMEIANG